MAKIPVSRRKAAIESYTRLYEQIYGQKPPHNSNAMQALRAGHDNVMSWRAEQRILGKKVKPLV